MAVVAQTAGSTSLETGTFYKVLWSLEVGFKWKKFSERELVVKDIKLSTGYIWKHKNSLGTAFVCPRCATVWGKITLKALDGEPQAYRIWSRPCEQHGGGSLYAPLDGTDRNINDRMPLDVLIREMDIAVE